MKQWKSGVLSNNFNDWQQLFTLGACESYFFVWIESAVRFVFESNLRIESFFTLYTYSEYLIHRYFVFVTRCTERIRNSELSTCLFQFSHKTRQTMLLYAYFTPKVDFKRKLNHYQSFLYEWRLTVRTIRKFRIGPSIRIESRIDVRFEIESRSFAGP